MDFEELVNEYYAQSLNSTSNASIAYSETYNETDVIYNENSTYSESCTPEDLDTSW